MSESLQELMSFDHVVTVHADGSVTDAPAGTYAPDVRIDVDSDGQISAESEAEYIAALERSGWELMRGYTGQYGYRGPIMHASEYIGGRMADDILEAPGNYVALTVECDGPEGSEDDLEPAGWVIAYQLAD